MNLQPDGFNLRRGTPAPIPPAVPPADLHPAAHSGAHALGLSHGLNPTKPFGLPSPAPPGLFGSSAGRFQPPAMPLRRRYPRR
ncbi:MAG: hypothetical protein EXR62_13930 [Chloroflexi bacterium]|nr:hypothetical protein [Chloroflexota bacterium]